MTRKYFGTDGIRGLVGAHPITPEFVLKLGWAVGHYFSEHSPNDDSTVIIGKDTRISGYMFESALQAGLVAAGVNVRLLGPMPTPAIAYLTRTFHAEAGIVISASHNAYHDNGIKFFSQNGAKLSDEVEAEIERYLEMDMACVPSDHLGKVRRVKDAAGRYIEFCKSTVDSSFSLKGKRVVLDCAHGATYHVAPDVFKELGAEVIALGVEPDGININEKVGSTSPESLQKKVVEVRADFGVAFDGDGDRLVFVDSKGRLIDGDELIYIIASQHVGKAGYEGVVGTLMTNMAVELAVKDLGLEFVRADVGDRYVKEQMYARNWLLGGESSGHLIIADATTTGDGIVSALKVLESVAKSGKTLEQLLAPVKKFPMQMINVKVKDKKGISQVAEVQAAIAETEQRLAGKGRVLLRPSGTEPVVRVMVEAADEAVVAKEVKQLAALVEQLGA
jgi:phosphoglucosamine mutase